MQKKMFNGLAIFSIVAAAFAAYAISQNPVSSTPAESEPFQPRLGAPEGSRVGAGSEPVSTVLPAQEGVITGEAVKHDVSPALRDLFIPPEVPATTIREMPEPVEDEDLNRQALPPVTDPVVQDTFGRGVQLNSAQPNAPVAGANFEGVNNIDGVYPPDTNGDVGPNHYVQMVNLHFAVYSKTGALLFGPALINSLWSGFGAPCQTQNAGDPIVLYDKIADRWLLSQFTAANPFGECVAVSTTPDPTGSYFRYFFQFSNTIFYDYPKLGIWPDGYYLTANRFGGIFRGASAIALNRTAMLSGAAASFQEFQTSTAFGVLLPSSLDGSTLPPAGSPNFVAEIGSTALHLWKFHVDWTTPANSTFTGPTTLPVAAFNELCPATRSCVPQPGTSVGVDGIGDRLMHRLAYRNFGDHEALVVTHNVSTSGTSTQAAVRWYEIRSPGGTPVLFQQGTYAPDSNNRWMGSLAMDHVGDMAMGYSVSSSSVFPGLRYTGRLVSDALGSMTQGETTLVAGSGSQTGTANRWGDYANIAVDPVDDCTFWFTSEYLTTSGTAPWRTRIGSFSFPLCTNPTAVTVINFLASAQPNGIRLSWNTWFEVDRQGFNLYRSEQEGGPYTLLNPLPMQPQGLGSPGSAYTYLDTSAHPGVIYFYRLVHASSVNPMTSDYQQISFEYFKLLLPALWR